MSVPRILYVSPCHPVGNGSGSQKRSFVTVSALRSLGSVYYMEVPPSSVTIESLRELAPEVRGLFEGSLSAWTIFRDQSGFLQNYHNPGLLFKLFRRAWVTAGAMVPISNHQSRRLIDRVREEFGPELFDVVFVFQAHTGLFVIDAIPHLLKRDGMSLIDWDAAERPAAAEQYQIRESGRSISARISSKINDLKLSFYERRLLDVADITLCASQYDVEYFRGRAVKGDVAVVSNCVAIPAVDAAPRGPSGAPRILFVGLINYWPNRHGLLLFLQKIWPTVRSRYPEAIFDIVGRGVTADIEKYGGRDGVNVIGEVDDVAPFYQASDIVVAPMIFSVGSSIKVLEALAFNRPLVAFEASIKRHRLIAGHHVSSALDCAGFADRIMELLADPVRAVEMAAAGRRQVQQHYAQSEVIQHISALISDGLQSRNR